MSFRSLTALVAAFDERYPSQSSTVGSISASGASVDSIAAAGYRPYSANAGKTVNVKAIDTFHMPGPTLIVPDDVIEVSEKEANNLKALGRVREATDAEVAAAQKKAK